MLWVLFAIIRTALYWPSDWWYAGRMGDAVDSIILAEIVLEEFPRALAGFCVIAASILWLWAMRWA